MPMTKEERIRRYLDMIAGDAGAEAVLDSVTPPGIELESVGAEPGPGEEMVKAARSGLETHARGKALADDEILGLEAIIIPNLRPVYDIVDGTFSTTAVDGTPTPGHALWSKLGTDPALKSRIEGVLPAIGRIELLYDTPIPYGGTGFVVGPNLVMTNRHVAQIFAQGLGDRALNYISGRAAGIDFKRDAEAGTILKVGRIRMIHPYWDMAILEVDGLPPSLKPLDLDVGDARDRVRAEVVVVGYPAFDTRNPTDVQNDVLHGRFQVKRLQPGLLQGGFATESFGKIVPAATHDCSTLGGNSGSAILDLSNGRIVGLHFAGRYLERNYAVPTGALARDQRVVDLGLNFQGGVTGGGNDWGDWWTRADGAAARETADAGAPAASAPGLQAPPPPAAPAASGGSVTFEVPLRITVSLGGLTAAVEAVESVSGDAGIEAAAPAPGNAIVPRTAADYVGRTGYDAGFLSTPGQPPLTVPMPDAADPAVLAVLKAGGTRLDYQNFSIRMHAARRLALVTASNVTREAPLREPEKGRNYSRKGLFTERWFPDLRLDEQFQIPEIFYSQDQGAFDKGHVVRRDDVAWGRTFDLLLRGNVDSFHVTNCSPQVEGYNRSDSGDRNWGDLENHVLSEAASERLCVFAGPILAADDRVFAGKGPNGTPLRAPVPRRFWKVIVARLSDGIASYGFVLEQDLTDTPLEFAVADEFIGAMYPLPEIARLAGVSFDAGVLAADQYDTVRGAEIALRAGTRQQGGGQA
jgi:endonuclease G